MRLFPSLDINFDFDRIGQNCESLNTRCSTPVQIAGAGVVAQADKHLARQISRMLAHVRAYHLEHPPEAQLGHTCCSMEPAPIAKPYLLIRSRTYTPGRAPGRRIDATGRQLRSEKQAVHHHVFHGEVIHRCALGGVQ